MVIYLKKDLIIQVSPTDQKVLPRGYHSIIEQRYVPKHNNTKFIHSSITNSHYATHTVEYLAEHREIFVVYYKRNYFIVFPNECEIPKTYKGWFNL